MRTSHAAQPGDGQRKGETEKQLLFFISEYLDAFCHVSEKQELENKKKIEAVLRRAAPLAESIAELCFAGGKEQ